MARFPREWSQGGGVKGHYRLLLMIKAAAQGSFKGKSHEGSWLKRHTQEVWNRSWFNQQNTLIFFFLQKPTLLLNFFNIFQLSSSASDSTAHRRWTVQQPEKQTPQSSPARRRWRPGPSWSCLRQLGPSETAEDKIKKAGELKWWISKR